MPQVLKLLGVNLIGDSTQQIRCPVHEDRSPSARYYGTEQRVYCFTCGKGWDALGVVMARMKLDRAMALAWLQARFQFVLPSLEDQMRHTLRYKPEASAQSMEAQLQLLDKQIRHAAPSFDAAVKWWTAVDYLQQALERGDSVVDKVERLRGIIGRP